MPKSHWGEHLDRALERLFNDETFLEEATSIRKELGIPKFGFSDPPKYWAFKKNTVVKRRISTYSKSLTKKRKLPPLYEQWVDAFIGLGFDCVEFVIPFGSGEAIPGHAYDVLREKDRVSFRAYKGATLNGFIKFIRSRWFLAQHDFKQMKSEAFVAGVRRKSVDLDTRNKEIFGFHKKGLLTTDGTWKGEGNFPYKLSREQRRNIIQEEKKRARNTEKYDRKRK